MSNIGRMCARHSFRDDAVTAILTRTFSNIFTLFNYCCNVRDYVKHITLADGDVLADWEMLADGDMLNDGDMLTDGDMLADGDVLADGDMLTGDSEDGENHDADTFHIV